MRRRLFVFVMPFLVSFLFVANHTIFAQTPTPSEASSEFVSDELVEEMLVEQDLMRPEPVQIDAIYPLPETPLYRFGQDHRYTITLRGNGEAVVLFRLALTNETENILDKVELIKSTNWNITQLSAYQIKREEVCAFYRLEVCERWVPADYYEPYFYGTSTRYLKTNIEDSDDKLVISFIDPVLPNEQGGLLVFMRVLGLTNKLPWNGFNYYIETMRVNENIKNLSVGIDTDPSWRLKNSQVGIDYVDLGTRSGVSPALVLEKGMSDGMNQSFDNLASSIGYGAITKSASGLAPLENMTLNGTYAKNVLVLYYKELLVLMGVVIVIALGLIVVARKVIHSTKMADQDSMSVANTVMIASHIFVPVVATLYTILLYLLFRVTPSLPYQYQPVLGMLTLVISAMFFLAIFVGSAVYVGSKKGVGWGVANLIINVFMYSILVMIFLVVVISFGEGDQMIPFYGRGMMGSAGSPDMVVKSSE